MTKLNGLNEPQRRFSMKLEHAEQNPYDFQVGDRVFDPASGKHGTIEEIRDDGTDYPVLTSFSDRYTLRGVYFSEHGVRRLYHEGTRIIISEIKPERVKWANLYFPDENGHVIGIVHNSKERAINYRSSNIDGAQYLKTIELTKED
jgi:hypothetical protein